MTDRRMVENPVHLVTFNTEDELREYVLSLNDDGIAIHIVIMDAKQHSVLASLTGCYADGFAYYSPNEDGHMHCCNCAECGPTCQEYSGDWKPSFPVVGLSPRHVDSDESRPQPRGRVRGGERGVVRGTAG